MVLPAVVLLASCGTPTSQDALIWDASVESNTESVDHSAWQELLDEFVAPDKSGVNVVDYRGLKSSEEAVRKLTAYLDFLQTLDPREFSRDEQMAYWINLYNAVTVGVVLSAYPVDTIRDIHAGVVPYTGPWNDVHATVAGEELSLDQIEHGILRPIWRDERIHYALNCAAYGCPQLPSVVFTAANTEVLLDAAARHFVNSSRGVDRVDADLMVISSIYNWYAEDFGSTEASLIDHLLQYAEDDLVAFLTDFDGSIEYDYDWKLNDQAR